MMWCNKIFIIFSDHIRITLHAFGRLKCRERVSLLLVGLCIFKRRTTEYAMGTNNNILFFFLGVKYKLAPPVVEIHIMFFPMRRNTGDSIFTLPVGRRGAI